MHTQPSLVERRWPIQPWAEAGGAVTQETVCSLRFAAKVNACETAARGGAKRNVQAGADADAAPVRSRTCGKPKEENPVTYAQADRVHSCSFAEGTSLEPQSGRGCLPALADRVLRLHDSDPQKRIPDFGAAAMVCYVC